MESLLKRREEGEVRSQMRGGRPERGRRGHNGNKRADPATAEKRLDDMMNKYWDRDRKIIRGNKGKASRFSFRKL